MQPRTKMWLIIGGFFGWLLVAGAVSSHYGSRYEACQFTFQRTLNQDRLDACLAEAGVNRHGTPENRLARLVTLR